MFKKNLDLIALAIAVLLLALTIVSGITINKLLKENAVLEKARETLSHDLYVANRKLQIIEDYQVSDDFEGWYTQNGITYFRTIVKN